VALAAAFARAANLYWFTVFPRARRQIAYWRRRASDVPDEALRRLALSTQREERGNLEGAAAFAAFAPRSMRGNVVRAAVAFQAIYDYVDSLVEQPADDALANGRRLHQALDVAVTPGLPHQDYYAHHCNKDDGGYLVDLVDTCRNALESLPSYSTVQVPARRAVARMVDYQTLIHASGGDAAERLQAWAGQCTPPGMDLRWWETAASSASSLLVFALMVEAAQPHRATAYIARIERTYHPWIGALHVLLDSLVDHLDDATSGHLSLVAHYHGPEDAADRLSKIARAAREHAEGLELRAAHLLLLAAMACFYLSADAAQDEYARLAARKIENTLGRLARPMLLILRTRRAAARGGACYRNLRRTFTALRSYRSGSQG